jgi:hypothetical protein
LVGWGGDDVAFFYDSSGNEEFATLVGSEALMEGDGFGYLAIDFPVVHALFREGGHDTAYWEDLPTRVQIDSYGSGICELTADATTVTSGGDPALELDAILDESDSVGLGDGWKLDGTQVTDGVFYRVLTQAGTTLRLSGPRDWTNPVSRFDVDSDGLVTPIDVLSVITEINTPTFSTGHRLIPAADVAAFPGIYYDADPDGLVTPTDVLVVINFINSYRGGGEGEFGRDKSLLHVPAVDLVFGSHLGDVLQSRPADATGPMTVSSSMVGMPADAGREVARSPTGLEQNGTSQRPHSRDEVALSDYRNSLDIVPNEDCFSVYGSSEFHRYSGGRAIP